MPLFRPSRAKRAVLSSRIVRDGSRSVPKPPRAHGYGPDLRTLKANLADPVKGEAVERRMRIAMDQRRRKAPVSLAGPKFTDDGI